MEVDENAPAGGTVENGGGGTGGKDGGTKDGDDKPKTPPGAVGFMLGLRLGFGTTFGDMRADDPIKDYYGPFGGGEVRGGVRIAGHYSGVLFAGGYAYQVGRLLNQFPDQNGSTAEAVTQSQQVGLGFQYAPVPQDNGIFGELDLIFVHRFETTRDVSVQSPTGSLLESCQQKLVASGNGIRLLGGYQVSLSRMFQLSPFLGLSFGQVRDVSIDSDCKAVTAAQSGLRDTPWEGTEGIPSSEQKVHGMVLVGVGGEFVFGSDNPAK
jgi:hypothetical protein